ncbi:hypothetical protein [Streptomyces nigrescens]|uniref:hypothetical protein n=1 Tax=Streptomyces nigrescens TaxID=1920 RepID=UPI0036FB8B00
MAFIHDDQPVSVQQVVGGVAVGQCLQHDQVVDDVATVVRAPAGEQSRTHGHERYGAAPCR